MEWHLQKRIDEISTISTRYETSVEQLLTEPGSQKITGVRIRSLKTGKGRRTLCRFSGRC